LTLGTTAFRSRVAIAFDFSLDLCATFFLAEAVGRFGIGFFPRATDFEGADLDLFRTTDFAGEALLA
jgi:hypothetical protein